MKVFFYVVVVFVIVFTLIDCAGFSLAVDGFVAYRSNTGTDATNSPKIRYWNNTNNSGNGSWSGQIELPTAGSPIRYLAIKQSPIDSKIVLVTSSDDGWIDGYVCMKNCINASYWNYSSDIGNTTSTVTQRGFDIAFESSTGDTLLAYGLNDANTARDVAYKELQKENLSFDGITEMYLNDNGHGTNIQYAWIMMDNDPVNTSSEILVGGFDDTDNDFNAWVWNGTAFGAINSITDGASATTSREAHVIRYSSGGSVGMVGSGTGTTGQVIFEYWNGASWTSIAAVDIDAVDGNDIQWMSMKADPGSNDLQLVIQDSGGDLSTAYWNGASWSIVSNIDTGVDAVTARKADFSWLDDGTGRLVWDTDGTGTTLSTRECNPQCNTVTRTVSTYAGTGGWIGLFRNPSASDVVKFLGLRLNANLDIGAFRYNGTAMNYTNYGDGELTVDTSVATFEAFTFDYRRDKRIPMITFVSPVSSGSISTNTSVFVNITSDEYLAFANLEWNGTNYSMNGPDMLWNYTFTGLSEGLYTYKIFATDLANNTNITETRNLTVNFPPNITVVNPPNNTLNNYSRNTTFYYNVTDNLDDVSSCSLVVDGAFVVNVTGPINETSTMNITYSLANGQHDWGIYCNDTNNLNTTSETRNITASIEATLYYISLDDDMAPYGDIILNAGSTRFVNCSATVGDPDGPDFINNASARFYHRSSTPGSPDDNNTHYTDTDCAIFNTTAINKTFSCGFDVLYYANNGTWICNITVNDHPYSGAYNISSNILPLYALNLTDGLDFVNAESGFQSMNITANITNFGNMPINVTLQGYALVIGDAVGMNCSDDTNITITNIRFSTNSTANFNQKIPMNGSIQPLDFRINKQIDSNQISNTTYWQITPDPGVANRLCTGHVLFSAQMS